jgi:hypothetical protein
MDHFMIITPNETSSNLFSHFPSLHFNKFSFFQLKLQDIKGLHISFPIFILNPETFTKVKFTKPSFIQWNVTSHNNQQKFYTYLLNPKDFEMFEKSPEVLDSALGGLKSQSIGQFYLNATQDVYLVFHNPSNLKIFTTFYATDSTVPSFEEIPFW